jgi:hypothetical protein
MLLPGACGMRSKTTLAPVWCGIAGKSDGSLQVTFIASEGSLKATNSQTLSSKVLEFPLAGVAEGQGM